MKKTFLTIMMLSVTLFAEQIHWIKSYAEAVAKAQKEHKPILFIVSKHDCKYCIKLKKETLSDPKIIQTINKNFVASIQYVDEANCMPYQIAWQSRGTPTIWFLYEKGDPLFQPIPGYLPPKDFAHALDVVSKAYSDAQKEIKKGQK